jgi:hypothetical protein
MKDFSTFTSEEHQEIEASIDRLQNAAATLQALLSDPKDTAARTALRERCDMNASFVPDRNLQIRWMLDRIDANACPDCWGTPDVCDCP